jgi:hypothetical protein
MRQSDHPSNVQIPIHHQGVDFGRHRVVFSYGDSAAGINQLTDSDNAPNDVGNKILTVWLRISRLDDRWFNNKLVPVYPYSDGINVGNRPVVPCNRESGNFISRSGQFSRLNSPDFK